MHLSNAELGVEYSIIGYSFNSFSYRKKLLALGLTPGTCIKVVSVAPLGDPLIVVVRGYSLALRKDEAKVLKLKKRES